MQSGSAIGETLEELHGGWQERPHTSVAISRNQCPSHLCEVRNQEGPSTAISRNQCPSHLREVRIFRRRRMRLANLETHVRSR